MPESNAKRKIYGGIIAIIVLAICLVITTFAIVYATVSVEENIFRTGRVKINLNNGEPIIREDEFLFEPGMTVVKECFIENLSTWDVYYKLYFGNVEGELARHIMVDIKDGNKELYSGYISGLSKTNVTSVPDPLSVMERKTLTVIFRFPKDVGNIAQGLGLKFDLCAQAVQTKNNPGMLFN